MCHTLLDQYCHTRTIQGFSYCILPVDQFFKVDFPCTIADVVHGSDPCHLILCFQLLGDALFLRQLRCDQIQLIASLSINVSEIAIQPTAENQIGVEDRTILSEILLVLPAPDADGVDSSSGMTRHG